MIPQAAGLRWVRRHGQLLVGWRPVNAEEVARLDAELPATRTPNFTVFGAPGGPQLVFHELEKDALDNDVGCLIAGELVSPGLITGAGAFERCFAGVVTSTDASATEAWRRFYVRTLDGLRAGAGSTGPDGPVAVFADVYAHAAKLVRGRRVLDVGSCFGFFPLLLAGRTALEVVASDCDPAMVALGRDFAGVLKAPVAFHVADVAWPLAFDPHRFDTVTALHLLEHMPAQQSWDAIANLCDVARRRVVIAVPLESQPDPVYGHVEAYTLDGLTAMGQQMAGWRARVHAFRGGWLILDRLVRDESSLRMPSCRRQRRRPRPSWRRWSARTARRRSPPPPLAR